MKNKTERKADIYTCKPLLLSQPRLYAEIKSHTDVTANNPIDKVITMPGLCNKIA